MIKALSIIFDPATKKQLEIDDFNKYIPLEKLKAEPPKITIAVTIMQSKDEDLMSKYGKTFEYELILANPSLELLIV